MNSLLSPSFSPTSLVSDSCRLDKGLIIPWICQALTSPMSPCAWCAVSGASPAENPISSQGWVWICVYLSMVPFKLRRSPYGVLGGLNSPSCGMLSWDMVVAWLGSVEHWLAREKNGVCWTAISNRLSAWLASGVPVSSLLPLVWKMKGTRKDFQLLSHHLQKIKEKAPLLSRFKLSRASIQLSTPTAWCTLVIPNYLLFLEGPVQSHWF